MTSRYSRGGAAMLQLSTCLFGLNTVPLSEPATFGCNVNDPQNH